MDVATLYLLFCGTVLPIVLTAIIVVWALMNYLTPKVSKTITRASIFRTSLAEIFQPNHVIRLVQCRLMPEGYLVTREKGRGKRPQYIPIARPVYEYTPTGEDMNEKLKKEVEKQNTQLRNIERESVRVSAFEGCRVPVFLVYSGVALAVNVETLVGLDSENDYRKVWAGAFGDNWEEEVKKFTLPQTMMNGGTSTSVLQQAKDILVRVLLPINPEGIKRHLSKLVDQTTIDGIHADGWQEGYEEGKAQKNEKMFLYMILALLGAGIAIMVMIHFA
jgi:hypothetical protein